MARVATSSGVTHLPIGEYTEHTARLIEQRVSRHSWVAHNNITTVPQFVILSGMSMQQRPLLWRHICT
jgi:hypothetical protein